MKCIKKKMIKVVTVYFQNAFEKKKWFTVNGACNFLSGKEKLLSLATFLPAEKLVLKSTTISSKNMDGFF